MISQNKQKGFTIVELLIVIVVIGILAAISIVAYNSVTQKARDTERATNAMNISKALSNYNAEKDGKWLNATEAKTQLASWKDPEIPAAVLNQLNDTDVAKDKIKLTLCGTSPDFTGAKIEYFREAAPTSGEIKAGSC